jgi:hypothetical protein
VFVSGNRFSYYFGRVGTVRVLARVLLKKLPRSFEESSLFFFNVNDEGGKVVVFKPRRRPETSVSMSSASTTSRLTFDKNLKKKFNTVTMVIKIKIFLSRKEIMNANDWQAKLQNSVPFSLVEQ